MKTVKLTRGLEAIVDDEDYPIISKHRWQARPSSNTFYASRRSHPKDGEHSRPSPILMHRLILGDIPAGCQVHHANGNGLDNRRDNLSIVTPSINLRQRKKFKTNTSGHTGIRKYRGRWQIVITAVFDTELEAVEIRQRLSDMLP